MVISQCRRFAVYHGPRIHEGLVTLIQERRLKYRLIAISSVVVSLLAGFYVISNLMAILVFLAFKVGVRTEAYSQAQLANTFSLQAPTSVWIMVSTEAEIFSYFLSPLSLWELCLTHNF